MEDFCSYRVYRLIRAAAGFYLRVYHRFQVHDSHYVPSTGGCIIAANHASHLDPPALAVGARHRIIHYMARQTLFKNPVGKWFRDRAHCVIDLDRDRGADVRAMRAGLSFLRSGLVLGLFPEGTRTPDGRMRDAKAGVGFLIAKARVPVVPAYVDGSFEALPRNRFWVRPARITVAFGPPMTPERVAAYGRGKDAYHAATCEVMQRIANLAPSRDS